MAAPLQLGVLPLVGRHREAGAQRQPPLFFYPDAPCFLKIAHEQDSSDEQDIQDSKKQSCISCNPENPVI